MKEKILDFATAYALIMYVLIAFVTYPYAHDMLVRKGESPVEASIGALIPSLVWPIGLPAAYIGDRIRPDKLAGPAKTVIMVNGTRVPVTLGYNVNIDYHGGIWYIKHPTSN